MNITTLEMLAFSLLLVAVIFSFIRLLIGPTTLDRLVAADTVAVIATGGLAGLAAWFNNPIYLDIALVYGILAFVGTVAVARSLEPEQQEDQS